MEKIAEKKKGHIRLRLNKGAGKSPPRAKKGEKKALGKERISVRELKKRQSSTGVSDLSKEFDTWTDREEKKWRTRRSIRTSTRNAQRK